jgi:hypothetical protein
MKEFEIIGNTVISRAFKEDVFQIVERIPEMFFVWNIGENMKSAEWIPLCEALHPGDKDDYSINPDTLKAINLPENEVKLLRDAADFGINSLATAEKALKSRRRGYMSDRKREQAKKVIDIFRRIS